MFSFFFFTNSSGGLRKGFGQNNSTAPHHYNPIYFHLYFFQFLFAERCIQTQREIYCTIYLCKKSPGFFLVPRGPLRILLISVYQSVFKKNPDHFYSLINHYMTLVNPSNKLFLNTMTHTIPRPPAMIMKNPHTKTKTNTKTKAQKAPRRRCKSL